MNRLKRIFAMILAVNIIYSMGIDVFAQAYIEDNPVQPKIPNAVTRKIDDVIDINEETQSDKKIVLSGEEIYIRWLNEQEEKLKKLLENEHENLGTTQQSEQQIIENYQYSKDGVGLKLPKESLLKSIDDTDTFSGLKPSAQTFLEKVFGYDTSLLITLEDEGLSLADSLIYAEVIEEHNLDTAEILEKYPTADSAIFLAAQLGYMDSVPDNLSEDGTAEIFKAKIIDGAGFSQISNYYNISETMGMEFEDFYSEMVENAKPPEKPEAGVQPDAAEEQLKAAALIYQLDYIKLSDYAQQNDIHPGVLADDISNAANGGMMLRAPANTTTYQPPDKYADAPFSYNRSRSEQIALNSGELGLNEIDLVLPGKNGQDLVISRTYSSSESNAQSSYAVTENNYEIMFEWYRFGERSGATYREDSQGVKSITNMGSENRSYTQSGPYIYFNHIYSLYCNNNSGYWRWYEDSDAYEYSPDRYRASIFTAKLEKNDWGRMSQYYYTKTKVNNYQINQSGLGQGWSFNFPSMESETLGSTVTQYLHMGDGRIYVVDFAGREESNLKKYDYTDMVFLKETGTVTHNTGNYSYNYVLRYNDGSEKLFNKDGKYLGSRDRLGNVIKFEYPDGNTTKITDTIGRVVTLTKSNEGVVLALSDGSQIKYNTGGSTKLLNSVTDMAGRTTSYEYGYESAYARYFSNTIYDSGANFSFLPLTKVIYPTGASTEYTYVKAMRKQISGYEDFLQLSSRKDYTAETDGSMPSVLNSETYTYSEANFTGYPTYKYDATPPSTFTYTTTVTDADGVATTHTFNNYHLRIKTQSVYLGTQKRLEENTYDSSKQLTSTKETVGSRVITTGYSYDAKSRDLLQTTDPVGNVTDYTYDPTYHVMLTATYKKGTDTIITQENTLTPAGGLIAFTKIFETVSGVKTLKRMSESIYDEHKNMIELRNYSGDPEAKDEYISQYFSYANTNPLLPAGFNNAFMTSKKIDGIRDADGILISSVKGMGVTQTDYKYDWYGRVIEEVLPHYSNGQSVKTEYDIIGRVEKVTYVNGTYISTVYDDVNNTIVTTDIAGNKTKNTYTKLGHIKYTEDLTAGVKKVSYSYDKFGRVVAATTYDENGAVKNKAIDTYIVGDVLGRLQKAQVVDNTATLLGEKSYKYTDNEIYIIETTQLGGANAPSIKTTKYYDVGGRLVKEGIFQNGTEQITTHSYDNLGNLIATLSALDASKGLGFTGKWEYDFAGNIVKASNAANAVVTYGYDTLGRKVNVTDPKGNMSISEYDNLGRVVKELSPFEENDGNMVYSEKKLYYDGAGNLAMQRVSSGEVGGGVAWRKTGYTYDIMGRITRTMLYDAAGNIESYTAYSYDALGNNTDVYTGMKTSMLSGAKTHIKYEHDRFGRVIRTTDAMGQSERATYNLSGELVSNVDRNGNTTDYTYDALGRALSITVKDSDGKVLNTASKGYTLTGSLLFEDTDGLRVVYTYDETGRTTKVSEPRGITKEYTYDIGGNRETMTVKQNGGVLQNTRYSFDDLNRLQNVTDAQTGTVVGEYSYDINGNRKSVELSDNLREEYSYNAANLVTRVSNLSGSEVLSSYEYSYMLDGNQQSKTDNFGIVTSYEYDGAGRLITEAVSGTDAITYTYDYDASSNREKLVVNGKENYTEFYNYDANNCLLQTVKTDSDGKVETTEYRYDASGNQIYKEKSTVAPAAGGEKSVTFADDDVVEISKYNGFNLLTETIVGSTVARYTYRPDGLRDSKTVNGNRTLHIWDGRNVIADMSGTDSINAQYLYGVNLLAVKKDTDYEYYLYNAHGDVVQLAQSTGEVSWKYDYDAFGAEKKIDGQDFKDDTNPFRYCGEYFDKETGRIYLRARYYNPKTGRFTQQDSYLGDKSFAMSLNLYTYCVNNPLIFVDPSGHAPIGKGGSKNKETVPPSITSVVSIGVGIGSSNAKSYTSASSSSNSSSGSSSAPTVPRPPASFTSEALNIVQDPSYISINVRVQIIKAAYMDSDWNAKYADLALKGIQQSWEGSYGSTPVYVNFDFDTSAGKYITIELAYDKANVNGSKGTGGKFYGSWDRYNLSGMILYNNNPGITDRPYNDTDFVLTAGHEFGHILGMDDLYYVNSAGGYNSMSYHKSIMNNQWRYTATDTDYERMLIAYETNTWQWPYEGLVKED